jgi:hypothetical protein
VKRIKLHCYYGVSIFGLINPWYDYQLVADQSVIDISTGDISKKVQWY